MWLQSSKPRGQVKTYQCFSGIFLHRSCLLHLSDPSDLTEENNYFTSRAKISIITNVPVCVTWIMEWSNEVAWRVSLVPRPLYRAFIPCASVHSHSADPTSQRFGHPDSTDSQIPTPSDGSVEQVTFAREYVGQGRLLMRDYKCQHVTRYLSSFIYTTSFSTLFRREGPFMNGRRKCERVAYDAILDRYAVLYI